jgi:putative intracellular protease/amidase
MSLFLGSRTASGQTTAAPISSGDHASRGDTGAGETTKRPRFLVVGTNVNTVGTAVSGTFLMEIALPFQHFINQRCDVDLVTPSGGELAVYHNGEKWDELLQAERNPIFADKRRRSLSPDLINPRDYAAIFYPGGHGQYWDVVENERIASIAARIHSNGGIVGTAGHGAASLVNIRQDDGRFFVEKKRMTCFPWWAEKEYMDISGYGKLLPFDMEKVLQRRGADLVVCTKETRSDKSLTLVSDDSSRLVTGAFASSAKWVAQQMVRLVEAQSVS